MLLVWILAYGGSSSWVWAGDPFQDQMIQSNQLTAPVRGSLAGELGQSSWTASDLSKGSFSLPLGMNFPSDRGALIFPLSPHYSPGGGLSEWGMGISADLSIRRYRVAGEIDFNSDDFLSPWGHLIQGSDGAYYSEGFQSQVRVRMDHPNELHAFLPDGTTLIFGGKDEGGQGSENCVETPLGIYAWYLSSAKDNKNQWTHYHYERQESGEPKNTSLYLKDIFYGGSGNHFQYHIEVKYESVPTPFVDYRSGVRSELNRRVSQVVVQAQSSGGGWVDRYAYELKHEVSSLNPAFYLRSIQKLFAPFDSLARSPRRSEPARTYHYDEAWADLDQAKWTPVTGLESALREFGYGILMPGGGTIFDLGSEGLSSIEIPSHDFALLRQQQSEEGIGKTEFKREDLPPIQRITGNSTQERDLRFIEAECRPEKRAGMRIFPRQLVKIRGPNSPFEGVLFNVDRQRQKTEIWLCSRDGHLTGRTWIPGMWKPGPLTRLVDLNRDGKPDLIIVGKGQYEVLENRSTDHEILFAPKTYLGDLRKNPRDIWSVPDAIYLQDMNGDGISDLVLQYKNGIAVQYGKGHFQFDLAQVDFEVLDSKHERYRLDPSHQFLFQDLNGDGITDLILYGNGLLTTFISDGKQFIQRIPEGLSHFPMKLLPGAQLYPSPGDFLGTGNIQMTVAYEQEAFAMEFTSPSTGLLRATEDGKGTRWTFEYSRARPEKGLGSRVPVVSQVKIHSVGKGDQTFDYDYHHAMTHSQNLSLLGFNQVAIHQPPGRHVESRFYHDDHTPSRLESEVESGSTIGIGRGAAPAAGHSALFKRSEFEYSKRTYQGIDYFQLAQERDGWTDGSQGSLSHSNSYQYDAEFCPSEVTEVLSPTATLLTSTRYVRLEAFHEHLICLSSHIHLQGKHSDSSLDFSHELSVQRDPFGNPHLLTVGNQDIQKIHYRSDFKVQAIEVPGHGQTKFDYDDAFRLSRVTSPDQVPVTAHYDSAGTDLIESLSHAHGGTVGGVSAVYDEHFAYDGQQRLSALWNNLVPSSLSIPLETLDYQYASAGLSAVGLHPSGGRSGNPGWIQSKTRLKSGDVSIWREGLEFYASDGAEIGTATHLDSEWVLKNIKEQFPQNYETQNYADHLSSGTAQQFSVSELFGDAHGLGYDKRSALGFPLIREQTYQKAARSHWDYQTHAIAAGEIELVGTENGHFQTFEHQDLQGHRTSFSDSPQSQTTFQYDALGRLAHVKLPNQNDHRVHYDSQGRVSEVSRTDLGKTTYSYRTGTDLLQTRSYFDSTGVLKRSEEFEYDHAGRVTQLTQHVDKGSWLSHSSESLTYSFYYDGKLPNGAQLEGQLGFFTAVSGPGFSRIQRYRVDGRLIQTDLVVTGWKTLATHLDYQFDGSVASKKVEIRENSVALHPRLEVNQSFELDHHGRLSQVKIDGKPFASLSYNGFSQVEKLNLHNLLDSKNHDTVELQYDPLTWGLRGYQRSIGKSGDAMNSSRAAKWSWNQRGFIGAETFQLNHETSHHQYHQDSRGMMSEDSSPQGNRSYKYDSIGLLAEVTEPGEAPRALPDPLVSVVSSGLSVDSLGRLTGSAGKTLTYGASGRVEKLEVKGQPAITYDYDETGVRLIKRRGGQILEVYSDGAVLAEDSLYQLVKLAGIVVGVLENHSFIPVSADMRGTVFESQDRAGSRLDVPPPFGDRRGARPSHSNVMDYAAQGYDSDLRVYRMDHRDYDPVLNRFHTPDPFYLEHPENCVASPIECNLYSYAKNNPVSFVDPSGLSSDPGSVLLYRADNSSVSHNVIAATKVAEFFNTGSIPSTDSIKYVHASTTVLGDRQYTADFKGGAHSLEPTDLIFGKVLHSGERGGQIDVFKHFDSGSFNAVTATKHAEEFSANKSDYGLHGWCSMRSEDGLKAGGLNPGTHGISSPHSLSQSPLLEKVGAYNTESMRSELPR